MTPLCNAAVLAKRRAGFVDFVALGEALARCFELPAAGEHGVVGVVGVGVGNEFCWNVEM